MRHLLLIITMLGLPALAADPAPAPAGTRRAAVELEAARRLYPQDLMLALRAGDAWMAVGAWERAERNYADAHQLSEGGAAAQRGLDAVRAARAPTWTLGGSTAGTVFDGDVDWIGGGSLGARADGLLGGRALVSAVGRAGVVSGQSGATPWVEGHAGLGAGWARAGFMLHAGGMVGLDPSATTRVEMLRRGTGPRPGPGDTGNGNDDPGNEDNPGNGNDDPGNGNDDPGNDDPGNGNDDPGNDDPGNDDPGNDDPGPADTTEPPDPDVPGGTPILDHAWTVGISGRWSPWGDLYVEASRTTWSDDVAHRGLLAWTSPRAGPFRAEPGGSIAHDDDGIGWTAFTTLRIGEDPVSVRVGGRIGDEQRPVSLGMGQIWAVPGRVEAGAWVGVTGTSNDWTVAVNGEWVRMERNEWGGPRDAFLIVLTGSRTVRGGS